MALAALAPLLGGLIAPTAMSAMGLSMPGFLASAIGSGLGGWAATGKPLTGLEDALGGGLSSGLSGMLSGALGGAGSAAGAASAADPAGLAAGAATGGAPSIAQIAAGLPTVSVDPTALTGSLSGAGSSLAGGAPSLTGAMGLAGQNSALLNPASYGTNALNFNAAPAIVGSAPFQLNFPQGGSGAGAATGGSTNPVMAWIQKNPLLAGVGGLAALSALSPGAKTPATTKYTSPGLTPYTNQTAVALPAGFQPGISPEPYYFSNPAGFADGGPVMANPYQQAAPGMVDLQLGLNPSQIIQRQLMQQSLQPAERYAGGGSIPQLPKPQMSVDNRGMSMLQREAMRSAMPYPHPAMAGAVPHMAMPHAVSAHIGAQPLGMATGGGVPGMAPGGLGGLPGMQVPDLAGDGSSDSIPATIDGTQPALLSSGEHVVPADVVSALGNGSTGAGSKQLHAMTNRVRMAKTGSKKMPARINAGKMMPA